jgi:hypothetical protein
MECRLMPAPRGNSPSPRRWTYAEYRRLPADEQFVRVAGDLLPHGVRSHRIASVAFPGVRIDLPELW